MRDESPDTSSETYEHIPWSRLTLSNETPDRGRWMYAGAALLAVAAVAAIVTRMIWQPGVASAVTSTTAIASYPEYETPVTFAPPSLYTEADLMAALPPPDVDRLVASAAEQYIRAWGTSATEAGWSYVEWSAVESVEDLGEGLFRVVVLMQVLRSGDGDPVRHPVEAAAVMVRVDGETIDVVDLPVPAPYEPALLTAHDLVEADLPVALAAAAVEVAAPWGPATVTGAGLVGQNWRILLAVPSPPGPDRVVAVWLTPDGEQIDPGT